MPLFLCYKYYSTIFIISIIILFCRYGWPDIVDALLAGRNIRSINVKNNQGKTALHFACAEGHDRVVEQLLKLGATVGRWDIHRVICIGVIEVGTNNLIVNDSSNLKLPMGLWLNGGSDQFLFFFVVCQNLSNWFVCLSLFGTYVEVRLSFKWNWFLFMFLIFFRFFC